MASYPPEEVPFFTTFTEFLSQLPPVFSAKQANDCSALWSLTSDPADHKKATPYAPVFYPSTLLMMQSWSAGLYGHSDPPRLGRLQLDYSTCLYMPLWVTSCNWIDGAYHHMMQDTYQVHTGAQYNSPFPVGSVILFILSIERSPCAPGEPPLWRFWCDFRLQPFGKLNKEQFFLLSMYHKEHCMDFYNKYCRCPFEPVGLTPYHIIYLPVPPRGPGPGYEGRDDKIFLDPKKKQKGPSLYQNEYRGLDATQRNVIYYELIDDIQAWWEEDTPGTYELGTDPYAKEKKDKKDNKKKLTTTTTTTKPRQDPNKDPDYTHIIYHYYPPPCASHFDGQPEHKNRPAEDLGRQFLCLPYEWTDQMKWVHQREEARYYKDVELLLEPTPTPWCQQVHRFNKNTAYGKMTQSERVAQHKKELQLRKDTYNAAHALFKGQPVPKGGAKSMYPPLLGDSTLHSWHDWLNGYLGQHKLRQQHLREIVLSYKGTMHELDQWPFGLGRPDEVEERHKQREQQQKQDAVQKIQMLTKKTTTLQQQLQKIIEDTAQRGQRLNELVDVLLPPVQQVLKEKNIIFDTYAQEIRHQKQQIHLLQQRRQAAVNKGGYTNEKKKRTTAMNKLTTTIQNTKDMVKKEQESFEKKFLQIQRQKDLYTAQLQQHRALQKQQNKEARKSAKQQYKQQQKQQKAEEKKKRKELQLQKKQQKLAKKMRKAQALKYKEYRVGEFKKLLLLSDDPQQAVTYLMTTDGVFLYDLIKLQYLLNLNITATNSPTHHNNDEFQAFSDAANTCLTPILPHYQGCVVSIETNAQQAQHFILTTHQQQLAPYYQFCLQTKQAIDLHLNNQLQHYAQQLQKMYSNADYKASAQAVLSSHKYQHCFEMYHMLRNFSSFGVVSADPSYTPNKNKSK